MRLTKRELIALMLPAMVPGLAWAHNNPSFEKVAIAEIEIGAEADEAGAFSPQFVLDLPKGTVQLHYEVEAEDQREVRFAIASGEDVLFADMTHESTTRPLRGATLRVVDVTGATGPFTLRVVAEVMVRATG